VIVPGLKKGAFIVGGKYGKGFASCRQPKGMGWTGPAAVRVEGGSVGFQIGGSESDVVLLVMNQRGMQKVMSSRFTLGAEGEVAAGPVGRDETAQTDAFFARRDPLLVANAWGVLRAFRCPLAECASNRNRPGSRNREGP
jgi:lipid-binding SYLF domain-containing protein